MPFTPLTNRIFNKIKSAIGLGLSEGENNKTLETEKLEPDYCPQAISQLKAYKKQHQDLKQQFSDFMSQAPFLPDVKWDEPFMSSPHYKDITKASKAIFDNLYDAKEEARKKLEELKEIINHKIEQEFSKLTLEEKINYLYSRCFGPTTQYQQPIPDLKKYELEFLYDNYQNQKLVEIITHRDKNPDMLRIFDCTPDQIIHNQQELQQALKDKKEIKAYIGELFPDFFKFLPQNVEYIYTKFPENRIRKMKITIGGQSKGVVIKEKKNQFRISDGAKMMLRGAEFKVSKEKENLILIRLKDQDLCFPTGSDIGDIFAKAEEVGLELCPSEVGPQLRKQYLDQPPNELLIISMKPIFNYGLLEVFGVENNYNNLSLRSILANSSVPWQPNCEIVFRLPKSET